MSYLWGRGVSSEKPMGRKKSEESHLLFPVSTPCFSPYSSPIQQFLMNLKMVLTSLLFQTATGFSSSNSTSLSLTQTLPLHTYICMYPFPSGKLIPISLIWQEHDRREPLRLSSVTLWFGKKTARSHEPQVASPTSIFSLHLASLGREVGAGLRSEFNVNDFAKCGGEMQ